MGIWVASTRSLPRQGRDLMQWTGGHVLPSSDVDYISLVRDAVPCAI